MTFQTAAETAAEDQTPLFDCTRAAARARADVDPALPAWKVLVVDDDEDVHVITQMVLRTVSYRSRGLRLLDAYSAQQAREVLAENPDVALILLDVVMETPDAGLQLVRVIREELAMPLVRIILRTGQPGFAPETEVMQHYDINDYQNKTELTLNRLKTIIIAGIRAYESIHSVEAMRRDLERTVQERTRELAESNALKDTMFSIVAHDLRGPIGNIKAFLDLLARPPAGESEAERADYLRVLQTNAGASLALLDNLLFWARSNQDMLTVDIAPGDICQTVREALALLSGQARAKGIALEFARAEPAVCNFDRNMAALVLRNLVANAIKFTPDGGTVAVAVAEREGQVEVAVADTGVGVEPGRLAELLSETPKRTTYGTRAETGSGLGLMLAVQFLRRQGSRLEVESQPGRGSRFWFRLPA